MTDHSLAKGSIHAVRNVVTVGFDALRQGGPGTSACIGIGTVLQFRAAPVGRGDTSQRTVAGGGDGSMTALPLPPRLPASALSLSPA